MLMQVIDIQLRDINFMYKCIKRYANIIITEYISRILLLYANSDINSLFQPSYFLWCD